MASSELNRQTIIEKAAVLFNEKGVAGTSIDDVLRSAKVSKGCLYGHFTSKDELSYASVDYMLKQMAERWDNLMAHEDTALGKYVAFLNSNKNPLQPLFDGGCPIVNFSVDADDTSPEIRKKVRHAITGTITKLKNIISQGILSGELSPELDPEEFALRTFASIEGASALCRVLNSNKPMQTVIKSFKTELSNNLQPA